MTTPRNADRSARSTAGAEPDRPTLFRRFLALMGDWVLCVMISNFFGDPLVDGWLPLLVLIPEYTLFVGLFAQTPGMALTGIRCVDAADGGRIGMPRALLRGVLLCLVIPPLLMDENQRGLHDRVVRSAMVMIRRA